MLRSTASLVAAASGGPRLLPEPGPAPPARSTRSSFHMRMDSFENLDWNSRRGCSSTFATSPSARRHASMSSRVVNVRNSFRAFVLSRP